MANDAMSPPYFITADDKRGLLVVTVAIVLAFVWVCSLIRIWLRYQARDWKNDDWLLAAATVLHTVQSGIIFHLVNLGLGVSQDGVPQVQLERIGRDGFASQILYVCTLHLSKCSVLSLYLRLSPDQWHRLSSVVGLAASTIWGIVSIVLISVPCNPAQIYAVGSSHCTNRWPKWQAIGALDIVTEAMIFGIAVQLIWTLQMRLKSKFVVTIAFSARLPVILIAGIRLHYLHERILLNAFTFTYILYTQWQMGYAIMSSTMTGMGPFLRPFDKEYRTSYKASGYGPSTERSQVASRVSNTQENSEPERNSWQSEGYLMQPINLRRASKTEASISSNVAGTFPIPSTSTTSEQESSSPPSPTHLTADANFRPIDNVSRNETEVWVGDRAGSFGTEDSMHRSRQSNGLVINKKKEFKIEVDRASRII